MQIRPLKRPLLAALAALFAAAAIFYSALWILYAMRGVPVELGFDNLYLPERACQLVQSVVASSPAERAGLRPGDCIMAINGDAVHEEGSLVQVWAREKPGNGVDLTVLRPGVADPLALHGVFRASQESNPEVGVTQSLGRYINNVFPLVFLTVGLAVLFLRLEDPNAWLLALMFVGFIATPGFPNTFYVVPASVRPIALLYRVFFHNMVAPFFFFFFTIFPVRSPLDRWAPWLKWAALVLGFGLAVSVLPSLDSEGRLETPYVETGIGHNLILLFNYGLIVLGLVSLVANALTVEDADARRKIRVIFWGTLVGVTPATAVLAANDFFHIHLTLWIGAAIVLLLWLFPLSFAYAVVKHRVLEIPVLLRRSARYLLVQRGFAVLLVLLSVGVTAAFALGFSHYLQSFTAAAVPGGIGLGTLFGTVLLWTGNRVHRDVGRRIDRAFFRSAYDAQTILEELLDKTRTATDRKELASLLDRHLREALQPSSVAVYFETGTEELVAASDGVPPESQVLSIREGKLMALLRSGQPKEVSPGAGGESVTPPALLALRPDCLVPILGRDNRLAGLVVLGARLSEESYSSEDKHLLAAIASQVGLALESIRLGERIAERIEAERRTAREMEIARQVQARLLPQKLPAMKTLEYSGGCVPARTVGGDYYDFLELRPGRLALVLADIAVKGVSGALLMANLQANLRSQYAIAVDDLPRLLASVNRLFHESTDDASYATVFFADYDDASRRLRYANCGHLPPLLLRGRPSSEGAAIERLDPTGTVMGLFEDWTSGIAEVQLAPGDTLVLYTDGVTEATGAGGEEFGESRIVETVSRESQLPANALLDALVGAVQRFSVGEQHDDITVVVARCLA